MKARSKTFDCVEMKHKAQKALLAEFDSRRQQFASLDDFLRAKAEESEWVSTTWARFGGSPQDSSK
jgi:hypothetical protein